MKSGFVCNNILSIRRQNPNAISGFQCFDTIRSTDKKAPKCWSTSGLLPTFCPSFFGLNFGGTEKKETIHTSTAVC